MTKNNFETYCPRCGQKELIVISGGSSDYDSRKFLLPKHVECSERTIPDDAIKIAERLMDEKLPVPDWPFLKRTEPVVIYEQGAK